MKYLLLIIVLLTTMPTLTFTQTNYYFEGTNTAFWFDASNWRSGAMPPFMGQIATISSGDSVFIQNQAVINTAHTIINNGVITIGDPVNFSFITTAEIGTFRNFGKVIIQENANLDTGDGGRIELRNGSVTDVYGSLSKQEFGSLSIESMAVLNLFTNALLEIF